MTLISMGSVFWTTVFYYKIDPIEKFVLRRNYRKFYHQLWEEYSQKIVQNPVI